MVIRTLVSCAALFALVGCATHGTISTTVTANLVEKVWGRVDVYLANSAPPVAISTAAREKYAADKETAGAILAEFPDRVPAAGLQAVLADTLNLHDQLVSADATLSEVEKSTYLRSTSLIRRAFAEAQAPLTDSGVDPEYTHGFFYGGSQVRYGVIYVSPHETQGRWKAGMAWDPARRMNLRTAIYIPKAEEADWWDTAPGIVRDQLFSVWGVKNDLRVKQLEGTPGTRKPGVVVLGK